MHIIKGLMPPLLYKLLRKEEISIVRKKWDQFININKNKLTLLNTEINPSDQDIEWYFTQLEIYRREYSGDILFFPIFHDRFESAGTMSGHYFHQDLCVAQDIFIKNPSKHVDIGSRHDGFVAHVASFREIEVFDIRPQPVHVKNVSFRQSDLMNIGDSLIDYCDSISALHSLEHFGLGRYGDTVCSDGFLRTMSNIKQILKKNGTFYFSVPIGPLRTEFNAHRVFSIKYLIDLICKDYEVMNFSYVDDDGAFHSDLLLDDLFEENNNFSCYYGLAIFFLKKK